jgi:hypothetical protein
MHVCLCVYIYTHTHTHIYCVVHIAVTELKGISFKSKGQWTIWSVYKHMIVWCVCILDTNRKLLLVSQNQVTKGESGVVAVTLCTTVELHRMKTHYKHIHISINYKIGGFSITHRTGQFEISNQSILWFIPFLI